MAGRRGWFPPMTGVREIIRQHSAAIVSWWMEAVSSAISARGLDRPELQNILPAYLGELASGDGPMRRRCLERHFATRIRQGFHLGEICEELALLGRCITRAASELAREEPAAAEIEALFAELHLDSNLLAEMYAQHMMQDEQADKFAARQLEKAAGVLQSQATTPMDKQNLAHLLEPIMTAMKAQTATLF